MAYRLCAFLIKRVESKELEKSVPLDSFHLLIYIHFCKKRLCQIDITVKTNRGLPEDKIFGALKMAFVIIF